MPIEWVHHGCFQSGEPLTIIVGIYQRPRTQVGQKFLKKKKGPCPAVVLVFKVRSPVTHASCHVYSVNPLPLNLDWPP